MIPRDIVFIYCVIDDLSKKIGFRDDPQCHMTTAEVMTVAIVSAMFFGGKWSVARLFLKGHGYFHNMLSHSRLTRRIHAIDSDYWRLVLGLLTDLARSRTNLNYFIVDSFPMPVCHPCRSRRSKLVSGRKYLGYCASKKLHYLGLKVHIIITAGGGIEELYFSPASIADITALESMHLNLPEGGTLYADRAYTKYEFEDQLDEAANITLIAERRRNSKRQHSGSTRFLQQRHRKYVETTISQITALMPRHIVSRTMKGFELRVFLFALGYSVKKLDSHLRSAA